MANIQNECFPFSQVQFEVVVFFRFTQSILQCSNESEWQDASIWNHCRWVERVLTRMVVGLALLPLTPSKRAKQAWASVLTPFLFPKEIKEKQIKGQSQCKSSSIHGLPIYIHSLFWFLGQLIRMWTHKGKAFRFALIKRTSGAGQGSFISIVEKSN